MNNLIKKLYDHFDIYLFIFLIIIMNYDSSYIPSAMIWLNSNRDRPFDSNVLENENLLYIKMLYDTIINNYKKLNKEFNFNDYTSVFTLYTYMYKNGYLSYKKAFNYTDSPLLDYLNYLGVDVINGAGCCRNISKMFSDILDKLDIENYIINLNVSDTRLKYKLLGNHSINMVVDSSKAHYFDPTNDCIFNLEGNLLVGRKVNTKKAIIGFDNRFKRLLPSYTPNYKMQKETYKIIISSLDILQKFYQDNREIYTEIRNKSIDLAYYK